MEDVPTEDEGGTQGPAAQGVCPAENATPEPEKEHSGAHKRKHTWLEIFAVCFAALAFIASAWQGWVMRDQEKRQLRAYVMADRASITVDASNNVHVIVDFRNSGLTPAYDFTGSGCLYLGGFALQNNTIVFEDSLPEPKVEESVRTRSMVSPNGGIRQKKQFPFCDARSAQTRPLTSGERERLSKGTAALYAYGHGSYVDAFGVTRKFEYRILTNDQLGMADGTTIQAEKANTAE
ncbi:MAG TPA: hypothetical protein VHW71_18680 [Steroidobacteraceae bacterium]|nr:hypothetical protein [Steroidobacteraceae bacterium]